MIRKILPIFVFILFHTMVMYGQKGYFQLNGRIYDKDKNSLNDVRIRVFEGQSTIDSMKTSGGGGFNLKFKLQNSYLIDIYKKGYAAKRVLIDTKVPEEVQNNSYRLLNFIFLDDINKIDDRSKAGLPVLKYYYNKTKKEFEAEKIGSQTLVNENSYEEQIKALRTELNMYKSLVQQQKLLLGQSEKIVVDANKIRTDARHFADSIVRAAYTKSQNINRNLQNPDSNIITAAVNKSTKEITKDDFQKLSVNENAFQSKKSIKEENKKIQALINRQNKSAKDSLEIKKSRLNMRQELFDLAKYQLEIDRLNARTKEDSMRIDARQEQLNLMKQDMDLAEQEIENANNKLMLKDLEIKNKNIQLLSFLVGSILLLFLLVYIYYNYRDKKRINKILEFQNQELEKLSIVASETSNAVIITDKAGNYTWVNKGYTRLFGYELSEVSGENPMKIQNEDKGPEINELINKSLETGETVTLNLKLHLKLVQKFGCKQQFPLY